MSTNQDTILRKEAWQIIDSGASFDIGFVLADRRRGTGGEYREMKGMQKVQQKPMPDAQPGKIVRPKSDLKRDPNHGVNKTVNIHNPRRMSDHIYKVHFRLFDRFNGKTVLQ